MLSGKAWAGIVVASVLCGCQHEAVKPVEGVVTLNIPTLTGDDARRADSMAHPVDMSPGDRLVVRLGAHGGTGFVWEMAGPAAAVLNATGPASTEPAVKSAAGPVAGADTWTSFQFQAIAQGQGDLRFILRRPWEATQPSARVVNVPITVTTKKDSS